jgi:hypothetical protein
MTPLKRLSHEISHHFLGGAPLDFNLLHINPVCNEEESNVNVTCMPTACFTILLQQHGALVVL